MAVVIDIETKADSAKRDLDSLNKSLAKLVTSSNNSNKALGNISAGSFKNINKALYTSKTSFQNFEKAGTKSFANIGVSATKTKSSVSSLRNTILSLSAAFLGIKGVSFFNKAADNLTNMQNRLKLVVSSSDELVRVQRKLFTLSKETRTAMLSSVRVYSDFAIAGEKVGMTQSKILRLTKTVNQAAALSGSSAEATNSALVQLSQGLSSGTLAGEELRSVMEQLPYLGRGIAKQFGMTTGQLKKFAAEGSLGPKAVMYAINRMSVKTQADFDKTVATSEQAFQRLAMSFNYMLGELNKIMGVADGFARKLMKMADAIDLFNSNFQDATSIFAQNIKNYLNEFNKFSAAELTLKTLIKLEITPDEIYNKYQTYRATKKYIDTFKNFFGIVAKTELQKPVRFSPTVDINHPSDPNIDLEIVSKLQEKQKLINAVRLSIKVTVDNILKMIPQIRGPVQTLGSLFSQVFGTLSAEVNALIYDKLMPLNRSLESVAEKLSLWSRGNNALSRAWVNLFHSKNLIDFRKNLDELNFQRQTKILGNFKASLSSLKSAFATVINPIQTVLVSLNLLDNQLVRIQQSRLTNIILYFVDLGKVVKRVYQDVFATTFEPKFIAMMLSMQALLNTFADAITDTFSTGTGQRLANSFVKGIENLPKMISELVDSIKGDNVFDSLFKNPDISKIQKNLSLILSAVLDFIKGFFSTIGDSVANSSIGNTFEILKNKLISKVNSLKSYLADIKKDISSKIFSFKMSYAFSFDKSALNGMLIYFVDLFERIKNIASSKLKTTETTIKDFSKNIKNYFFDIYDKVVGHSYWPDMIDGVNNYAKKIFDSRTTLTKFKDGMISIFKTLSDEVLAMGNQMGGVFAIFVNKLADLNISDVFKTIGEHSGATFLAGLFYSLGSSKFKIAAVAYFISLADSVFSGAITAMSPILSTSLGASAGALSAGIIDGTKAMLNNLIDAFPVFVGSLISSLIDTILPVGDVFTSLLGKLSIFQNSVLHGIILIGTAYGLLTKKGFSNISDIVFGKTNKKTKVKTDGIVDYISAAFAGNSDTSKIGKSFFNKAFNSKKLAVLAAGVFSSAMLESVSIFEAATIGVPLLAYAIMGKDGGGKVLKESLMLVNLFGNSALGILASLFRVEKKAFNLLQGIIPTKSDTQSAFKIAGNQLFDSFKQMVINLRTNGTRYAAGRFSLTDALLSTSQPRVQKIIGKVNQKRTRLAPQPVQTPIQRTRIPLAAQIKNVADEFKLTEAGKNLTEGFLKLKTNVKSGFDSLVGLFKGTTFSSSFKTFVKDIFKGVGAIISNVYSNVKTGIQGLVSFATAHSKILIGVISAFIILGSTAVFAASDANTAFSAFTDNLAFVTKGVGTLILALATLGYAIKVYTVFKAEGFIAALEYIGRSLSWVKKFGFAIADIVKNKFFSAAWWNRTGPLIGKNLKLSPALMISWQEFAASVATSARELKYFGIMGKTVMIPLSGIGFGIQFIILSLRTAFEVFKKLPSIILSSMGPTGALGKVFLGLAGTINTVISAAIAGFGMLIKAALSVLRPLLIMAAQWIAIPAAIGAIGLFLFGPGNNFVDRIEWAYDKIRKIFGLESKTRFGRMNELQQATKPMMMGSNMADIQDTISKVDTAKQTEPQFAVLKEAASSTMAALKDLQSTYIKQGFVSQKMLTEWNKLITDFKKIASHQPQDETKKPTSLLELSVDMLTVETSAWDLAKAMLGIKPVFGETAVEVGSLADIWSNSMNFIIETVSSGLSIIGGFFSAIWTTLKTSIGVGLLVGFGTYVSNLIIVALGGVATAAAVPEAGIAALTVGLAALAYNLAPVIGNLIAWVGSILQLDDAVDWIAKKFFGIEKASFILGDTISSFWGHLETDFYAGYDGIINHTGTFLDEISSRFLGTFDWILKKITGKTSKQIVKIYKDDINKELLDRSPRRLEMASKLSNMHLREKTQYIADPALKAMAEASFKEIEDALKEKEILDLGYKPENNQAGALSPADFAFKNSQSEIRLARAMDVGLKNEANIGPIADADKKVKEFSDSFTLLGEEMKNVLTIDMGTNFKDFLGYSKDIDTFKASVEQVRGIDKDLSFTFDFDKKGQLEKQKADIIKRTTEMVASIKAHAEKYGTIDLTFTTQANLLGNADLRDSISNLKKYDSTAYKAFSDITHDIELMQQELANLNPEIESNTKRYYQLKDAIEAAQLKATKKLPQDNWVDALNTKLQKLNLTAISVDAFAYFSEADTKSFNSQLDIIVQKEKDLAIMRSDRKPFEEQIKALKEIFTLQQNVSIGLEAASNKALASVVNDAGSDLRSKLAQYEKLTGDDVPTTVRAKGESQQYMDAKAEIKSLETAGKSGQLSPEYVAQQVYLLEETIAKLGVITKLTLSSIISSFGDLGLSLDNLGFSRLSSESQSFLAGVSSQLQAIETVISESAFSAEIGDLLKTQETLLLSAADTLLNASYKTGTGITSALERFGLSENKSIANLNKLQIDNLLELDKAAEKARILASRASNPEDYLKRVKDQARATIRGTQEAERMANSFEKNISNLNEVFKTSLDGFDATSMSPQIISSAMDIARELKNELEIAIAENKPTADLFERLRSAELAGGFITLFKDLGNGLRDALVGGAKSGFDKIKSAYSDSQMTFKQYAGLDPSRRRQRAQEATYQESFKKAANMELSPEQATMLDRIGSGEDISKVMKEFESAFSDLFKSDNPVVISQDNLKKSIDDLKKSIDIDKKEKQIMADISSGKISEKAGIGQLNDFVADANKSKDIIPTSRSKSKGVGNLSAKTLLMAEEASSKRKEFEDLGALLSKANFKGVLDAADGFGKETMNLASDAQLKQAAEIKVKLAGLQAEMADATLNKLDTQTLQKKIDSYTDELGRIPYAIDYLRNAVREAGVNMRDTVDSTFRAAFTDLLKGKATEGESAFKTFTTSIMDNITGSVVDTFAKGITDRITGPGSPIAVASELMGKGIYSIFGDLLDGISGISSSESGSGDGIMDSISGFFSNMFSSSPKKGGAGGGGFFSAITDMFGGGSKSGGGIGMPTSSDPNTQAIISADTANTDRLIAAIKEGKGEGKGDGVGGAMGSLFDSLGGVSRTGTAFSDLLGSGSVAGGGSGLSSMNSALGGFTGGAGTLSGASGLFTSKSGMTGMGVGDSLYSGTGSVVGGGGGAGQFDAMMGKPMDTSWLDDMGTSISDKFTGLFGDGGSILGIFDGFGGGLKDMFGGLLDGVMKMFGGGGGGGGFDFAAIGTTIMGFFADGGVAGRISGSGTGTSDSIPAMLSNGEFVVNAKATKGNLKLLNSINSGSIRKLAGGGLADNMPQMNIPSLINPEMGMTPKTIDMSKAGTGQNTSNQVINLSFTGDISRQTKAEVYKMLPSIAQGVNLHNKEKGYRG